MTIYEDVVAIKLESRTGAAASDIHRMHGATGLYLILRVKTIGTGTLTFRVFGIEPFEDTEFQVNLDLAMSAAVQNNHFALFPGVAKQPDGEAAATTATAFRQAVAIPMPTDRFILRTVKSDGSAWEYGASFRRVP